MSSLALDGLEVDVELLLILAIILSVHLRFSPISLPQHHCLAVIALKNLLMNSLIICRLA